jgi:formylmethanofuran dehydrogenase subunit E-like metal-binding protein
MELSDAEQLAMKLDAIVNDTLIIDENGRTVWCKDLAKRYRAEMQRGKDGDFKGRVTL